MKKKKLTGNFLKKKGIVKTTKGYIQKSSYGRGQVIVRPDLLHLEGSFSFKNNNDYSINENPLWNKTVRILKEVEILWNEVLEENDFIFKGRASMPTIRVSLQDRSYYHSPNRCLGEARKFSNKIMLITKLYDASRTTTWIKKNLRSESGKNTNGKYDFRNVVLHELGHGIFGLDHCRRRNKRTCPIMARYAGQKLPTRKTMKRRFKKLIYNHIYRYMDPATRRHKRYK